MPLKNIIEAIEKKQSLRATELLEKSLYIKAGVLLEEKKKQVAARTWPARNIDKAKSKADRRKMLKEKLKKEEKAEK